MTYPRFIVASFATLLFSASLLHGQNAVLRWNDEVLNASRLSRNPPPVAAIHLATFHAAIFEAVNGIDHRYQGWLLTDRAPSGANMDAAIASAAHAVLVAVWGNASNPQNFDAAYQKALAETPDDSAKQSGIAWGRQVAKTVLAARAKSGLDALVTRQLTSTEPGKWRETPPGFRPPVAPQVANVTPFILNSPHQFRAPPPQPLDSKEYLDELALVARVGPRDGAERTEYQTLSTPFWADDLGSATPAGHWNVIAQDLARRNKLPVVECARLFALLNFATADAGIACWETKYFYSTWRPETAIREMDSKVNPNASPKPHFIPNMASPAFPAYVSGHSSYTGAAARLLALYFGTDDIEFTTTSDGLPGAVRSFKRLSDAAREVNMSRVWGGIHTMTDVIEGQKMGTDVADWVFAHCLQPEPRHVAK